jgi:hypothetical protein
LTERGYKADDISKKLGLEKSYAYGIVQLLKKGEEVLLQAVDDGRIPLRIAIIISALWQYLWVERPVQDSAPWKSPRAGVSPTRLRGQFEAQLSEQNMEAAARQHFA